MTSRMTERTLELPIVGKGKHIRTIFISPRAGHWIRAYLASRGDDLKPLFINSRSRNPESKRLTPRAIQLMIAKYARLAGLSKKVTPHTMRHTYATDLLSHGADLQQRPGASGPQERVDHPGLHPRHQQAPAGHP